MADPRAVVPYHDPYNLPLPYNILNFGNDHNPTLADLSNEHSSSLPQHGTLEGNDPYSSPMIEEHVHHFSHGGGKFEAGPSELHGESHPGQENLGSQNFSEVVQLSFWPEPPIPYICSCCQVLREIVYTNGVKFSKLEIHGRLGMICHAIHQQNINVGSSGNQQIQMFDFCSRSIEETKLFLMQYCMKQHSEGYYIVQDPLSAYYEALCIGMDWTDDINDEFVGLTPDNSGGISDEAEDDMEMTPRVSLAAQRERAGKMKLSDFSDYFHLPIEDAAKEVNLCPTVVKKICRKAGLARWPHRKVKSIVKQIKILRRTLNSDAVSRTQTQGEIDRLYQEMIQLCGGIAPTSLNFE